MPVCDVCDRGLLSNRGYTLSNTTVGTSEAYWKHMFSGPLSELHNIDPKGQNHAAIPLKISHETPWIVCDKCALLFSFDRNDARQLTKDGKLPSNHGPADLQSVSLASGYAWSQVFGSWPEGLQVGVKGPHLNAPPCDFCRRRLHASEEVLAMKGEAIQPLEEIGALVRRGSASSRVGGQEVWRCCSMCIARSERIAEKLGLESEGPYQVEKLQVQSRGSKQWAALMAFLAFLALGGYLAWRACVDAPWYYWVGFLFCLLAALLAREKSVARKAGRCPKCAGMLVLQPYQMLHADDVQCDHCNGKLYCDEFAIWQSATGEMRPLDT
jgi:hypothetical protein